MTSEALEAFTAAIGSLKTNPAAARKVFALATRKDPSMADAWLGRLATGENTLAVWENLARTVKSLGKACELTGFTVRGFGATWPAGEYLTLPVVDAESVRLGLVGALIHAKQFDRARDELGTFTQDGDLPRFMRAALGVATERWTDVLAALGDPASLNDPNKVPELMAARANAAMGLFAQAQTYAKAAQMSLNKDVERDAIYVEALATRHAGDEATARNLLTDLSARWPEFTAARSALADKTFGITLTDADTIDSRTVWWDPASVPPKTAAAEAQEAEAKANRQALLEDAERDLHAFIGLQPVKQQVAEVKSTARMNLLREKKGLPLFTRSHHLIFAGPPGTGKTTIARVVAKIYCGLGILSTHNVKEVRRAELVGSAIGETEEKTNAVIDSALNGVLLIDEAYALVAPGMKNDFGLVAIDTLLARMENDRDRLAVFACGYPEEMVAFKDANDGLERRFPRTINFPSYEVPELLEIAGYFAGLTKSSIDPDAMALLEAVCTHLTTHTTEITSTRDYIPLVKEKPMIDVAGNAGFIRNVVEFAGTKLTHRLDSAFEDDDDIDEEMLGLFTRSDFHGALDDLLSREDFRAGLL
ncbi:type VII secretion AAA-ATPase EccA [Mycobacteroides abscessus]|uniref:type VII secretion AAA-ATPase EccA n=1 Tax=Mycobacteroides abscessus TaxID=36809 RepID=UPI000928B384|nr:type VII secretion AAA-ATPase EccA [Mycobacteroides abscessus]SHV70981.1 putative ESX-3 secretion system protein [Mycobacteroides abscessus subsp. abscessus]SHW29323.1 putative ESX-3 secretion system protein [Mycobacteroides abscessus subsp. abscessus]SHW43089.1 putative ESX-3 secretion system protein [Mycobacteroides abscessus subsp. abscessus]SHW66054.1 putative ESX-3 secretion system protein [Mycobacteroides abscessus subsp. abscessus]SHX16083.1 putative ESX-3 secretion system protein [M